jgi:hypothetical protein
MKCSTECPMYQRSLSGGICLADCRIPREDGWFDCSLGSPLVVGKLNSFVEWIGVR